MSDINKTQGVIIGIIFLLSALGGWFVTYVYSAAKEREESALTTQSQVVAAALDQNVLSSLTAVNSDLHTDSYLQIKHALERARAVNEKSRFVYIVMKKGDRYYFAADAEPSSSEDFSPPGEWYDDAPEALDWSYRQAQTFVVYNSDKWGAWISAFSPVIDNQGKVIAVVGVDTDASEHSWVLWVATLLAIAAISVPLLSVIFLLKIYLNERSLSQLRNEFMALAAHELRAPMTAISWTANSMLASKTLTPPDAEKMQTIVTVTKTLIGNITSILSLVKLEKMGVSSRQFEKVNFSDLVTIAVGEVQLGLANQKRIRCTTAVEADVFVLGNQTLLTYTCMSLLTNAVKYSPEDTQVDVRVARDGRKVQLEVSDRGIGIPEEERKKIFAGFYRATNAQKSGATGSGFGLYIIQRILGLHGGTITSANREGGGSVFCVTLPVDYKITA